MTHPREQPLSPAPAPGTRYRPVRLHARGGLGEVHLAEDATLERAVALKRIRPEYAHSPEARRRFQREAALTARLEHPGIVPIYDLAEQADGQPGYAMRFVEGQTFKEAIERYHHAPDRLAFRQLLGHFVAACQAIAYAHSKGVIHRDLKPSNILLGQFGETLVVDWGLAKVVGRTHPAPAGATPAADGDSAQVVGPTDPAHADTEETLTTAEDAPGDGTTMGQAVGTPAYMPPEQAAGRWHVVGPAAAIYGLGATLYHVLTGQAPFQGHDKLALLAQVQRGACPPPRQANREVPRALDAICRKAMALEPGDRYATATALAADVEHWLADEPVAAYREPPSARLGRWTRRHRTLTVSAGVLLVAAVVGLGIGLAAVTAEQQKTQAALAAETKARALALDAVRSLADDLVEQQLARRLQLTDEDRAFLRKVLAQFERLAALPGEEAEQRAFRAEGQLRIGRIQQGLGELQAAETAFRAAITQYERLAADFPAQPDFRHQLALGQNDLGQLLATTGRLQEAAAQYDAALALCRQLAAAWPDRPEHRAELVRGQNNRGRLLATTSRLKEAEAAYGAALAVGAQLVADFPARPEFRAELAQIHNNLGDLRLATAGTSEAAAACLRQAIALRRQLTADFPTRPAYRHALAGSLNSLGNLLRDFAPPQETEAVYRETLTLRQRLAADFPTHPDYRGELARTQNDLGQLLSAAGRRQEAEAAYRQALALCQQLTADLNARPEFRQELARTHSNQGSLYAATGRPQEAESAYRAALALCKQLAADFPTHAEFRQELAGSHNSLGDLLAAHGRPREAEAAYRAALALRQRLVADVPTHPDYRQELASNQTDLGQLFHKTGRPTEAEAACRAALALYQQLAADFPARVAFRRELARSHSTLGGLLHDHGRLKDAEAAYAAALALHRQLAADFPEVVAYRQDVAATLQNLVVVAHAGRDFAQARRRLDEALPYHLAALQANPRHADYRLRYRNHLVLRAETCAGAADQAAAVQVADKLRDIGWDPPDDAYEAACALARCIPIVEANLPAGAARERQVEFYADRALALLRLAVTRGFRDSSRAKQDMELDSLRQRADFQKFLTELEARVKNAPGS